MSQDFPQDTPRGERSDDIYSRLLRDRIIFLGTPICDGVASVVIAQLLYLQSEDPDRDVSMYINSHKPLPESEDPDLDRVMCIDALGGEAQAGLAIFDTMQFIRCDVATYCIGACDGMATVLLSSGTPGKRYALPAARIHMQPLWGPAQGNAADIMKQANEIGRMSDVLFDILARNTGQSPDQIRCDLDRSFFLSAQEAKEYGLIDEIIDPATAHLRS